MSEKDNGNRLNAEALDQIHTERLKKQAEAMKLCGKFQWIGDLEEMRTDTQHLQDWYDSKYAKKDS